MKKIRKFVAVAMIAVMGFTMSGCIGSFALTNKVLDWNRVLEINLYKKLFSWDFTLFLFMKLQFSWMQ